MNDSIISHNLDASLSSITEIQKSIDAMETHLRDLRENNGMNRKNKPHTKSLKLISEVKQGLSKAQQKSNSFSIIPILIFFF